METIRSRLAARIAWVDELRLEDMLTVLKMLVFAVPFSGSY